MWRVETSAVEAMAIARGIFGPTGRRFRKSRLIRDGQIRVRSRLRATELLRSPSFQASTAAWRRRLTVYLAASNATVGWKPVAVEIVGPNWLYSTATAAAKSVLGTATSALPDGSPDLVDDSGSVDVQLLDPEQWLTSCDDDALMAGANLALVGSEILQFGGAEALGDGAFRLSRLLRGRGGTEWAISGHGAGDAFVLIGAASLRMIAVPDWSSGLPITVRQPPGQGDASTTLTITGDSLRPWCPVGFGGGADAHRRPRSPLDSPQPAFAAAGWTMSTCRWVSARRSMASRSRWARQVVEYSCDAASLSSSAAADVASLGAGTATIAVRQIGDWGASRPAELEIILD